MPNFGSVEPLPPTKLDCKLGLLCAQRAFLIARATNIVAPFGETVQQVFARISAVRDSLDGPQLDDQGLFNTDPCAIAVPASYVNFVPTDIQGITFGQTPQQAW
ncbi:hypothetical protein WJX84_007046 [Apatococcus fuscideae]|uniref:Uncharacterized protein n=1 Tax=Apatococcus fuscideae TaxID=2026836 RepID=A0AAW1RXQ8_9CHLO